MTLKSTKKKTADSENKRLIKLFKKANKTDRPKYINALYKANEGFIVYLGNKYVFDKSLFNEFRSEAYFVVLNCAKKFNLNQNTKFSSYLATALQRLSMLVASRKGAMDIPPHLAGKSNIRMLRLDRPMVGKKILNISVNVDYDKGLIENELGQTLNKLFDASTVRYIRMYFWEDMTYSQIGEAENISREWVRQKVTRAINKLSKHYS